MKGQWLGEYSGDNEGKILLNIDETRTEYIGTGSLYPHDNNIPYSYVTFIKEKACMYENNHTLKAIAEILPIDPETYQNFSWESIKHHYPLVDSFSKSADIEISLKDDELTINATTDINLQLYCILKKSAGKCLSEVPAKLIRWKDFKNKITEYANGDYVFRGQGIPLALKTSFHRQGRYVLRKYLNQDIKKLHRSLSSITSHFFDINVPDQNGAFINLLQHHGYPTPLLDWTYSPYVAAYFAFREKTINRGDYDNVRVFILNLKKWQLYCPPVMYLDAPFPHLSVMEFITIGNNRAVPQQALTTLTNLDDIERYINLVEQETEDSLLTAIDIPYNQRKEALRELSYMGISAGSLFPGIDGICEELREKYF